MFLKIMKAIRFMVIKTETEFLQSRAQNIHTFEGQKKVFILDNMAYIHSGLRPQFITDYNSNGYSVNTWQMAFLGQKKEYWNGLCMFSCATLEPLHNFDNILKKNGQLIVFPIKMGHITRKPRMMRLVIRLSCLGFLDTKLGYWSQKWTQQASKKNSLHDELLESTTVISMTAL